MLSQLTDHKQTPPQTGTKPRRRVIQNTLFSILSKGQSSVFSYVTLRLLLNAMTVEEYGFYTVLFQAVLLNMTLLAQFGVPSVLIRFIPEFFNHSRWRQIGRLFSSAALIQVLLAGLLMIVVMIWTSAIARLLNFPGQEHLIRIFTIGALSFYAQENFRTMLGSIFRHRIVFILLLVYNVLRLAAIFFVVQFAFSMKNIVIAEVAVLFAGVLAHWIAYFMVMRPLIHKDPNPPEKLPVRRYVRYGGLFYLNELGNTVLGAATDLFLVTGLLGGTAVGLYGLANRILLLVRNVMPNIILKNLIEPLFFSEYGAADKMSMRNGFTMLSKLITFVVLPITIWLALMARPVIVYLFEPKYADAAMAVALLALTLPLFNQKMPYGLVFQSLERIDLIIYVKVVGVIKVLAGLYLVPKYGMLMMAWISLVTSILEVLMMDLLCIFIMKIKNDYRGLLKLLLNGLVMAALFYPMRGWFDSTIGVILSAPVAGLIFLVLNIINKPFRKKEREFLNEKLPYRIWIF